MFQRRGGSLYGTSEGKSWEAGTGMGRQGPCPGVLTQENCLKVTQSVEDAEIKTNVLKQNSALLEVRGEGVGQDGQTQEVLEVLELQVGLPAQPPPPPITTATAPSTFTFKLLHAYWRSGLGEGLVSDSEQECLSGPRFSLLSQHHVGKASLVLTGGAGIWPHGEPEWGWRAGWGRGGKHSEVKASGISDGPVLPSNSNGESI